MAHKHFTSCYKPGLRGGSRSCLGRSFIAFDDHGCDLSQQPRCWLSCGGSAITLHRTDAEDAQGDSPPRTLFVISLRGYRKGACMANRQIEQAKVDIDAALLLIQGGD